MVKFELALTGSPPIMNVPALWKQTISLMRLHSAFTLLLSSWTVPHGPGANVSMAGRIP